MMGNKTKRRMQKGSKVKFNKIMDNVVLNADLGLSGWYLVMWRNADSSEEIHTILNHVEPMANGNDLVWLVIFGVATYGFEW